ncbi:heterokaryon incompatibility protein-domain-containing protein [Paraphoma chrysanthemicola]|nr:heterokaryon incompatibility protein-domain-containing protein [Paraphoma chrysanthemicola]
MEFADKHQPGGPPADHRGLQAQSLLGFKNVRETNDDRICRHCSSIPWRDLRREYPKSFLLSIPEPAARWDTKKCNLCKLLKATVSPEHLLNRDLELMWQPTQEAENAGHSGTIGCLWFLGERQWLEIRTVRTQRDHALLQERDAHDLDIDQVRFWLEKCEGWHNCCEPELRSTLKCYKVIDCESLEVIAAPKDCSYVALSYVWGRSIQTPAALSMSLRHAPQTILDSMKITRELGFRYLWVDRYCIDQAHAIDKRHQIQQMGAIYSAAELTIIASAGDDPSCGLPGVSIDRETFPEVTIGTFTIQFIPEPVTREIFLSIWASRAWDIPRMLLVET